VYAPIFPELERLYVEATKQKLTVKQRKRLEMLSDNLVVLHWNLRNSGLLKDPERSLFYREESAFRQFMAERRNSLALVDHAFFLRYRWQTALWVPEKRALEVARLPEGIAPPQVDGSLADDVWKAAGIADQFRTTEGERGLAEQQTVVRALYDEKHLYLAFECAARDPTQIRRACTIANSESIFSDDVVEVYLQPEGGQARHLAVNAGGIPFSNPTTPMQAGAAIGAAAWTAELAVPMTSLKVSGPPRPGEIWHGNFARRKVGPPIDNSAWCRVEQEGQHGDPRAFGQLQFGR
jgi:hypothetical protein